MRERERHTHTRTHSEGSENRNENREQHVPQTRGEKSEARSTKKCMQYRRLAQPSTDLSTFVLRLPRYFEYRAGGWDHKSIVQEFQRFLQTKQLATSPLHAKPRLEAESLQPNPSLTINCSAHLSRWLFIIRILTAGGNVAVTHHRYGHLAWRCVHMHMAQSAQSWKCAKPQSAPAHTAINFLQTYTGLSTGTCAHNAS